MDDRVSVIDNTSLETRRWCVDGYRQLLGANRPSQSTVSQILRPIPTTWCAELPRLVRVRLYPELKLRPVQNSAASGER